ncbi:MAG: blue (type 1) copper domain protein [Polaromonas sp.]|nr:blue (type 1) copper domain protein [Polaromonas sp.]
MKNTLKTIAACALLACATATFAAGNHAGGHAHGPAGAPAIGEAGVAANVTRTVEVDMSDAMRFTPATIQARQGETIRFVVKNSGQLGHEFVLGTEKDLKAHYEVMKKNPHMEHAEDNMLTVAPGQSGELLWRFTRAGTVDFACLQPGHYDAGMKGAVAVAAAGQPAKPATGASGGLSRVNEASPSAPKMDTAGVEMSSGEVRKIDKEAQKITLKHGPIKNLDMPGMTMVFKAPEPSLLDKVKAGDKVKFTAEDRSGAMVVTAIETVQ